MGRLVMVLFAIVAFIIAMCLLFVGIVLLAKLTIGSSLFAIVVILFALVNFFIAFLLFQVGFF